MIVTKEMVSKSIYEHGMEEYMAVDENPSGGIITIRIPYEHPDASLFHTISAILDNIETSNNLVRGCLNRSEVKIYRKEINIIIRNDIELKKPVYRISVADRNNAIKVLVRDGNLSEEKATELLQLVSIHLLGEGIFKDDKE